MLWVAAVIVAIVAFSLWGCQRRITDNFYIVVIPVSTTTTGSPEIEWEFFNKANPEKLCVTTGCYCNGVYVCQ